MIRSRALLTLAALTLTAGLSGCGDETAKITTPATASPAAAPVSLTPERSETVFLDTTAAHLCSIQSRVYTDPSAMAEAYASKPVYTGLSDAQVEQFQQRVIADPAFAGRLTGQIQATCG